jgi:hypothetical protein
VSIAIFVCYALIPISIFMRVGIDNEYINAKKREAQSASTSATVPVPITTKETH